METGVMIRIYRRYMWHRRISEMELIEAAKFWETVRSKTSAGHHCVADVD